MGPWLAVAAVALALPTAVAQSNCEKCATNSQCTYASTSSKNVNVLHAFCGTVSNTFYCCPTLVRDPPDDPYTPPLATPSSTHRERMLAPMCRRGP